MSICLAATWYPRGESSRLARLLPVLEQGYAWIVVACILNEDPDAIEPFISGEYSSHPAMRFFRNEVHQNGRYLALQKALDTPAEFIHYTDMDRLLHWVETRPEEWKHALEEIEKGDSIIFGRTPAAYLTHPRALMTTEQISNRVVSHILKEEMDVSAGSKSFSCSAAQYLVEHCQAGNSIGTDAEWPIRLRQAGFRLRYITVDGLDWESADQYHDQAVTGAEQAQAAQAYDADPGHWSHRVEIAWEIIRTALEVAQVDKKV